MGCLDMSHNTIKTEFLAVCKVKVQANFFFQLNRPPADQVHARLQHARAGAGGQVDGQLLPQAGVDERQDGHAPAARRHGAQVQLLSCW